MNKQFINCKKIFDSVITADCGGEYVLPDVLPDAKRIVHVFTQLRKTGVNDDANGVTVDGEATFGIIFCGDDGALHGVKYVSPFTAKTQIKDYNTGDTVITRLLTPDTSVRLSNPRKFSVKCKASVALCVLRCETEEPFIEGVQDESLQYNCKNGSAVFVYEAEDTQIPLSEDIKIPESMPEPDSIVCLYAIPRMPMVTASDESVNVISDVDVSCIYTQSDGETVCFKSSFKLEHGLSVPGATSDSVCTADVDVYDVKYELAPDHNGEMRVIELDLTYDVSVVCETAACGDYIADMYSTDYESEATYKNITLVKNHPAASLHFTVSGETEYQPAGKAVFSTAECGPNILEFADGVCSLSGQTDVLIVRKTEDGYENGKITIPYKIPLNIDMEENDEYELICHPAAPNVRADKEKVFADTELYVTVLKKSRENAKALQSLIISETKRQKPDSTFVLYRPDNAETSWDVAKKFGVSAKELEDQNPENQTVYVIST